MRKLSLYLLIPKNICAHNSPWLPEQGTATEMVVYAYDEKQAREIADSNAGRENAHRWKPWKSDRWSQCIKLNDKPQTISIIWK